MSFKVEGGGFSKPAGDEVREGFRGGTSVFIRSRQDNPIFKDLQVKDISNLVTEDCVNYIDFDSIPYECASSVEEDYIEVENIETKEVLVFKNKTEFKGGSNKEGVITVDSWLGNLNIKLEAKGDKPLQISDFTITPKKKLKFENGATIDGLKFKDSLEVAKYYLDNWVHCIKEQTTIKNIVCILGEGETHRHSLLLPKRYKEGRVDTQRPLLLKELRQYVVDTYPHELAPELYEADEICDAHGWQGYLHYRKTGKFNKMKSGKDKDTLSCAGLCFNYTKSFHFEYPQCFMIEASDVNVGEVELIKTTAKATGLKMTALQLCLSDSADGYGSRKYLPKEMKPKVSYGDVAFYKDFLPLNTPNEVLGKCVDLFYEWFPHGLQYTAWDGTEIDEDTLWWMEQCFACLYMKRSLTDNTKLIDLLKRFKVDTSKITNNNKLTPPQKVYVGNEDHIKEVETLIQGIVKDDMKGIKALKKADQGVVIDRIRDKLLSIEFESHYEMKQYEK